MLANIGLCLNSFLVCFSFLTCMFNDLIYYVHCQNILMKATLSTLAHIVVFCSGMQRERVSLAGLLAWPGAGMPRHPQNQSILNAGYFWTEVTVNRDHILILWSRPCSITSQRFPLSASQMVKGHEQITDQLTIKRETEWSVDLTWSPCTNNRRSAHKPHSCKTRGFTYLILLHILVLSLCGKALGSESLQNEEPLLILRHWKVSLN